MRRARQRRGDNHEVLDGEELQPAEQETGQPALTAWDRVKLARHPDRPHFLDYINELMTGFIETAAANRSVCPTIHAVKTPPPLPPVTNRFFSSM